MEKGEERIEGEERRGGEKGGERREEEGGRGEKGREEREGVGGKRRGGREEKGESRRERKDVINAIPSSSSV